MSSPRITQALTPRREFNLTAAGEVVLQSIVEARRQAGQTHDSGEVGLVHGVLLEAALRGLAEMGEVGGDPNLQAAVNELRAWLAKRS